MLLREFAIIAVLLLYQTTGNRIPLFQAIFQNLDASATTRNESAQTLSRVVTPASTPLILEVKSVVTQLDSDQNASDSATGAPSSIIGKTASGALHDREMSPFTLGPTSLLDNLGTTKSAQLTKLTSRKPDMVSVSMVSGEADGANGGTTFFVKGNPTPRDVAPESTPVSTASLARATRSDSEHYITNDGVSTSHLQQDSMGVSRRDAASKTSLWADMRSGEAVYSTKTVANAMGSTMEPNQQGTLINRSTYHSLFSLKLFPVSKATDSVSRISATALTRVNSSHELTIIPRTAASTEQAKVPSTQYRLLTNRWLRRTTTADDDDDARRSTSTHMWFIPRRISTTAARRREQGTVVTYGAVSPTLHKPYKYGIEFLNEMSLQNAFASAPPDTRAGTNNVVTADAKIILFLALALCVVVLAGLLVVLSVCFCIRRHKHHSAAGGPVSGSESKEQSKLNNGVKANSHNTSKDESPKSTTENK